LKLRLGAAVLLAALTSLTAVTAPSATAGPGADITPPEVGSCHNLTYDEYLASSEPDPAVECSARHTSFTVRVKQFDAPPDWSKWSEIVRSEYVPCLKDLLAITGGSSARLQMTSYGLTFYRPTKAQRDAGATWVRCDAVLRGGIESLAPVPENVLLDGTPPASGIRKCRLGKAKDYAVTVCTRTHQYIATVTVRMRGDNYPGEEAAQRFAHRKCIDKLGNRDPFVYEWVPNRYYWRAGLRNAVCLSKTS